MVHHSSHPPSPPVQPGGEPGLPFPISTGSQPVRWGGWDRESSCAASVWSSLVSTINLWLTGGRSRTRIAYSPHRWLGHLTAMVIFEGNEECLPSKPLCPIVAKNWELVEVERWPLLSGSMETGIVWKTKELILSQITSDPFDPVWSALTRSYATPGGQIR